MDRIPVPSIYGFTEQDGETRFGEKAGCFLWATSLSEVMAGRSALVVQPANAGTTGSDDAEVVVVVVVGAGSAPVNVNDNV